MGDAGESIPTVQPAITSPQHEELLNLIDKIRSQGISRYVDIPQIVVCGDQSSGKSSTLEALCGHKFPTGDGLCTRFATEFILRRSDEESIAVSIVPDPERPDYEKSKLESFKPGSVDLKNFQSIVDKATSEMGVGQAKNFAHDVLRIEISGPDKTPLTLVDLPGLFHSETKDQSKEDRKAVYSLVGSYIAKSRSIILAVVSAKNDVTNQVVLDFARKHDPSGDRTLGIITKPDRIEGPTGESIFLDLAQNRNIKFALGWHVIKNRDYKESEFTPNQRDESESNFFSKGIWKNLDAKQKGVGSLRVRLSKILQQHIHSELPGFVREVEKGINDCENKLRALGNSRATPEEQRLYLLQASQSFVELMSGAVSGNYGHEFFGNSSTEEGYAKRLCAVATSTLKKFAEDMRTRGHAMELVDIVAGDYKGVEGLPRKVGKEKFYKEVEVRMDRNSGLELPGYPSSTIIRDLFFEQAAPWTRLIEEVKNDLLVSTHTTVSYILEHSADDATISGIRRYIVNPNMEPLEDNMAKKATELLHPSTKGTPRTLNHYFTDLVQHSREKESQKELGKLLHRFFGVDPHASNYSSRIYNQSFDVGKLLESLTKRTEADMGRLGAIEAVNGMLALYKTQLKTIIDSFHMYAVQACLLERLPSVFTPAMVLKLDSETVRKIAAESMDSMEERTSLNKKLAALKDTQKDLHLLDRHKPTALSITLKLGEQ